jgi:hypothetical protein
MVIHGFDMYRVFISSPGDLGTETLTCRAAISEVNEKEAMPFQTLLVSVGLPDDAQITTFRAAVADNIRQCTYYIQVYEDDWGPQNLFRKMFFLAADCRDDPKFPMREAVVFLKDAPRETDPQILAFRKELEELTGTRVFRFANVDVLKEQLLQVCGGWVSSILATSTAERTAE